MARNLLCVLILAVIVHVFPTGVLADEHNPTEYCPLDGYISSNFIRSELPVIEIVDQPVVVEFSIKNDSALYSYGAISIGVGLYGKETDIFPAFWASIIVDEVVFYPQTVTDYEKELDVSHVPAGEYVMRIGVAQGDQLAALANSRESEGIQLSKKTTAQEYPLVLSNKTIPSSVGTNAIYKITAENTTNSVLRDFDHHLVLSHKEVPIGSAVVSSLTQAVKMIPGATEVMEASVMIENEGTYTAIGYATQNRVFLPVVTDSFVVGSQSGPANGFIAGVGVSGLTQTEEVVEIVSCLAAVSKQPLDVMYLEQQIDSDQNMEFSDRTQVTENGFIQSTIKKENLDKFKVVSKLYTTSNQTNVTATSSPTDVDVNPGILTHSIQSTFTCAENCQSATMRETLGAFAAEDAVKNTVWFYLGIILASILLFFLMLGRLAPPEEEHEPMHEPE